ncbi:unnamed protein product [Hymenolepis diminuta]|uniref:Malectin domain-containing protein n=1 Tax=Hymenolepis diminuta TaxID=6216 RepID=A0A0R3SS71_HYMDI|nr:unnamed protein product [Hymenolepis diminuta]
MRASWLCVSLVLLFNCVFAGKLHPIFAVNCGGDAHTDVNGVRYQADTNEVGIASSHGMNLILHRTPEADAILYQTERYDTSSFSYEFPMPKDGEYILHLKFSEVWFHQPQGKVFSIELNGGLRVVDNLDIYNTVGFSVAHEENIPIKIKDGNLITSQGSVQVDDGEKLQINFLKTPYDNPKVNAIALFANSLKDIPKLPPIEFLPNVVDKLPGDELQGSQQDSEFSRPSKRSHVPPAIERPPALDPYASADYSTYILPAVIAIASFIPIILCLYRM